MIILICFDAFYEFLKINNILGLKLESSRGDENFYLTGFFNDEKKLGSFLVRILPFIISLIIYLNYPQKYFIFLILIFGILIFLASERVALFLFFIFLFFILRVMPKKIYIVSFLFLIVISLTISQPKITKKYVIGTLFQMGILESPNYDVSWKEIKKMKFSNINYFSAEHEDLIKSGLEIFKERPLIGSGVKTHYEACNKLKLEKNINFVCSTHPHNTYIQLLSDTGILSAFIFAFTFLYIIYLNIKIFFKKNINNIFASFYVLNIGIILNLMPFIPSGSIYNNWINIMIYYPIGYWLYLYSKIKKKSA